MDPFKNIRPYTDSEVDQVLQSLTSNESVIKALMGLQFPGMVSKIPFLKFFVKQKLISKVKNIHTIDDYQKIFKSLMENVVQESISTFSVNGLENLNQNNSYLFISNHRDITLDAGGAEINFKDDTVLFGQFQKFSDNYPTAFARLIQGGNLHNADRGQNI